MNELEKIVKYPSPRAEKHGFRASLRWPIVCTSFLDKKNNKFLFAANIPRGEESLLSILEEDEVENQTKQEIKTAFRMTYESVEMIRKNKLLQKAIEKNLVREDTMNKSLEELKRFVEDRCGWYKAPDDTYPTSISPTSYNCRYLLPLLDFGERKEEKPLKWKVEFLYSFDNVHYVPLWKKGGKKSGRKNSRS